MKPLRVLLLTVYYEPEITAVATYVSQVVKDLARQGCEVQVVAPMPTRDVDKQTRLAYRKRPLEVQEEGRLRIRRVYVPFREPRKLMARALRYALVMLVLFGQALFRSADVVLLFSAPPLFGLLGAALRVFRRTPVVYYLQDIFPDSMINSGVSTSRWPVVLGKWMEKVTYRAANRIIVICRDFRDNLLRKGVNAEKMDLIYNWVDENAVRPVPRAQNCLVERLGLDPDAFYVTYSGNVGHTQNLEMMVDAAIALKDRRDIRFLIIGNGAYEDAIKAYAADKCADNVDFIPFQDVRDISHVLSIGDVGVILSKRNIGRNSFPSKTWNIMAAERPLIASFDMDSELRDIIAQADCGFYVPPDDCEAFVQSILRLYGDHQLCQRLGCNGRRYIEQNLTRAYGTAKVHNVLQKAAGR